MPRARVKLSPTPIEAPPEWWQHLWYERQAKIRGNLLPFLRAAGRAMTAPELSALKGINARAIEVHHALDRLVEDGVLTRFERTEPSCFGAGSGTRTYTYYDLVKEG